MSKIGIIFCAYGTLDLTPASLAPWLAAKAARLGGHDYILAAVSCPFSGFPDAKDDGTVDYLFKQVGHEKIDHLVVSDTPIPETEARGRALQWLVGQGCDLSIMVDSDEFWTIDQIAKVITFMVDRPFLCWAKVCLKNYVFDMKTYLVEPFAPPRIHRLAFQGAFTAAGFEQDNDVWYSRIDGMPISQQEMTSATIPKGLVWVKHLSWISNERSRKKIKYQTVGRGWGSCSFSWDDSQGGLIWNPALPVPETAVDA